METKRCPKCGLTKSMEAFYVRKTGRDAGYVYSYCNECATATRKKSNYKLLPANRRESMQRHRKKYPEREKARGSISTAVCDGKISRPERCERCEKVCKPEGHHPNY